MSTIRHVVLWTMKDEAEGNTRRQNILLVKKKLEALRGRIPGLVDLHVFLNENAQEKSGDLMLETVHESWEALASYQTHPLHEEVASFIGKVRQNRMCVDLRS